jgi:molybdopterin/thiamine biosynthesis adenylyltransferase
MAVARFDPTQYYSRQIALKEIGEEGQERLRRSKVAVIGVGGIGTVSSLYLTLAGVGSLVLVDQDTVELHNLHRQILFSMEDLRLPKAEVAAKRLARVNPEVSILSMSDNLSEENAEEILKGANVVVDGLDNMRTRYIINSACSRLGLPYVFGGAIAMEGNVSVFHPPETPCLECVLPAFDDGNLPGCDTRGVLGATAGIIGSIQAMETVKLLTGVKDTLKGKLLVCDFRRMDFEKVEIFRRQGCGVCGDGATERPKILEQLFWLCGGDTVNVNPIRPVELNLESTLSKLREKFTILATSPVVVVFRDRESEVSLFKNGRMLIKGVAAESEALKIYNEISVFFAV